MSPRILTEIDAMHATSASEEIAGEIIREGLAKVPDDVLVYHGEVFSRAYLADGEKASFYLSVGRLTE